MTVFKPKTRMISFRISEEEYQSVQQASLSHGARSVSDFSRECLLHLLHQPAAGAPRTALDSKIEQLSSEFKMLNRDVETLRAALRTPANTVSGYASASRNAPTNPLGME